MTSTADTGRSPTAPWGHGRTVLRSIRRAIWALPQRLGETRLGVLAIGRVVSPLQRQVLRLSRGRVSLTGRAPVLLLTTVGRRTGLRRTVPVFYLRDGDRLVVCNVNPGFENPNPWTLNLRANPNATVEIRGSIADVRGREASHDEVERYWSRFVDLWPAYREFSRRGGTRSLFVLEPLEGSETERATEH